jgi:Bax protein
LALAGVLAAIVILGIRLIVPTPPAPGLAEIAAYDLEGVRAGGAVDAVFVDSVGTGLQDIADTARRKQLFLRLMLPLILRQNRQILEDRKRVWGSPTARIRDLYAHYGVREGDVATLGRRVDAVPPSLVLAQAAIESGWGASRFVDEGNNFFGQHTYDDAVDGLVPAGGDGSFKVRHFRTIAESVRSYLHNLNTHRAYAALRRARAAGRRDDLMPPGLALARHLTSYSERREDYVRAIEEVIRSNRLDDFDAARLATR